MVPPNDNILCSVIAHVQCQYQLTNIHVCICAAVMWVDTLLIEHYTIAGMFLIKMWLSGHSDIAFHLATVRYDE